MTTVGSNNHHVLIVGGGIGGLCLAQGLKKHGVPFTVFERDPTPDYRPQGYRLRINSDGYDALEAALSEELMVAFLQSNAAFEPGFVFHDPVTGERTVRKAPPVAPRGSHHQQSTTVPRAFATDRATLRAVLRARLTPEELRYDMGFKAYTLQPNDEGVLAEFDNGEVVRGTLLVGADGTNSRVRKQFLPEHRVMDTDGRAIFGKTLLTPEFEAVFPKDALSKTALVTNPDPLVSLFSEPMRFTHSPSEVGIGLPEVDDYLYWVLIARSGVFGSNVDPLTPEQLKQLSLRITEGWSPALREVFERQEPGVGAFIKISTTHPTIEQWTPMRVTLLGDAVHAMTPAGIGANTALQDARVLLECLLAKGVGTAAVGEYEAQMRVYASAAISASLGAGQKMFGQPPLEEMTAI
jgi:2-polyprenyl-6-methoxyphenol hydroxylase-like FAD-dependent oxidoreductase